MGTALALAFTAGLVATVNPCGIAMLPAYLAWLVGGDDRDAGRGTLVSAVRVGVVMSLGVIVVLVAAGVAISLGLRALIALAPWLAIGVGAGLVVLGWRTLTGRSVPAPRVTTLGPDDRRLRSVALFGASYALASLSCTMPVFLAVVAGSSVQGGVGSNVATILAYGVGMSVLLVAVTIAVAAGRRTLVHGVRAAGRRLTTISGVVAIVAGVLLVWFWTVNLAAGNGAGAQTGVFPLLEQLSSTLSNRLADAAPVIGVVSAAVVALAGALLLVRRLAGRRDDRRPADGDADPPTSATAPSSGPG